MTTKYVVTDEQEKKFQDRLWELESRWRKSILDPELTLGGLQLLVENKRMAGVAYVSYSDLLTDWQAFYRDVFGVEADFTNLAIPAKRAGFDRLLINLFGPQRLYDKCKELFPSWKWTDDDLDKIVTSDRSAKNGAYAVWVRDRVEADEELKNISANQLEKQGILGITLEERLVYEIKFFRETGKHLDIHNWTLCAGSRCGGGGVPRAGQDGDGFRVVWSSPGHAGDDRRSRQAVS